MDSIWASDKEALIVFFTQNVDYHGGIYFYTED